MLPAIGMGGWNLGDDPSRENGEIAALRRGIELGANLIDTAEMYGDGRSELLIGRATRGLKRGNYMLVSKVYPHNAGREHIFNSCKASLSRLNVDYLDLYLLHWRGTVPLAETVECMEELVADGMIKRWGVSNFDVSDMEELLRIPGGEHCAVDQVLYNIESRGIEFDLLPWLAARGIAVMAYCPLAQAGGLKRSEKFLPTDKTLIYVAEKYKISVFQLMLAFVLRRDGVMAIPKAGSVIHTEQNAAAADIVIAQEDLAVLDGAFWPPTSKMHLDMD